MKIKRRKVPPLVGLAEAAKILGIGSKANVRRLHGLPEPVNDRGIEGFEVSATPLWHRAEIEELAAKRGNGAPPKKPVAKRGKAKRARRAAA